MGGARAALRDATGAAHERLHHLPLFQELASGSITREGYAALLRRMFGFHRAVEQLLAEAPPIPGIDPAARQRSTLIIEDLASLGSAPPPDALAPLPRFGDAGAALGCLYVAEGSTLGGQMLARRLDHLLPAGSATGRGFLLGHGPRHAAMWVACCAAVEACGATPAGQARLIAGATATFAAFESWFRPG